MNILNLINSRKRAITIVIAFIIAFSLGTYGYADSVKYENGGIELWTNTTEGNNLYNSIKDNLPKLPGNVTPASSIRGYPLNFRLWLQKGLLVYGNYNSIKDKNQFKLGTQPSPGVVRNNDGYYYGTDSHTGLSGRGEWRYHGIDVSGNLFSNMNFIDDGSNTKFNEREWIKEPWSYLPLSKRPNISNYNYKALNLDGNVSIETQAALRQWINKSLSDGVPLKSSPIDPETYKYLNILSAPTSMQTGQGRMWHKKEDGSIWYQTLSVPVLKESLQNLPVTVAIYCTNPAADLMIDDPGVEKDNQKIALHFKVIATLEDEKDGKQLYSDPIERTKYYTRNDINYWSITFNDNQTIDKVSTIGNKGVAEFSETVTYGYLRSKGWKEFITASAQPTYKNTVKGNTDHGSLEIPLNRVTLPAPSISINPVIFTPDNNIPEVAFEGVPFHPIDNSDTTLIRNCRVYVDGLEVDDSLFFSGSYVFDAGDMGENGRFAVVEVDYEIDGLQLQPGDKICTTDYVYIYPTKPIANFKISSSTWKQNRKIKIEDTSTSGNIQLVVQNYPITEYEWTFGGDTSKIKIGTDTMSVKEFICKQPGIYSATLRCKNSLGKWSDPYTVDFEVLEDVAPAIGLNLTDSVTNRNETMDAWYYNICSTDGDVIKTSSIELWYDEDNDGTLDTKLSTWDGAGEFPSYTPTKLGYYKYIVKAQEDIVGDTFMQFINDEDKKTSSYEVEWWVDNFRPMSDLYINIPIQRPNIDVYFMLDKNLSQTKTDYMSANRMNIANWLIGKNIIPNVQTWDMKTYTYTQPASTSSHTGSSYPASSISYSSNGYSGTLSLSSVSNNRYSRDEGHNTTQTESKTASGTQNGYNWVTYVFTVTNPKTGAGSWSQTGRTGTDQPTMSYSDSLGFSGTLNRTGASVVGDTGAPSGKASNGATYTRTITYLGNYSGTVTRTVEVWVPNIVWYNDYTGYYSGTIYKYVRQEYSDPFNPTSIKYVIYISDNNISELSDLQSVMNHAKTAKLILAGASGISSQITNDKYYNVSEKSMDVLVNDILEYMSESSPAVERYYVLQNQAFTLNTGNLDLENDPITAQEIQYVHYTNYFDNPTGVEPGTVSAYSDSAGWSTAVKGGFANTGLYEIYRRIKDNPSTDPNFAQYAYYSGSTRLDIYVHRKPIALATLDWDFDAANNVYRTTWLDKSYDLDHLYNRPDKGIVERNIMWRQTGGEWNYGIPDKLSPGTYELWYYVRDPEGAWSDPFAMNFSLSTAPNMQFDAKLRTLDSRFSLNGIPASEFLEAYDVWTRYPYNVSLQMGLYNGTAIASPIKTVMYNPSTGVHNGNDITWNNIAYPVADTVPDGIYTFRITSVGDYGKSASKEFPVTVNTPINLEAMINGAASSAKIQSGAENAFTFKTSKYVSSVKLVFKGNTYTSNSGAISLAGTDDSRKTWAMKSVVPANSVTDGETGYATFTAYTPSGKSQSANVDYSVIAIRAYDFTITSILDVGWRGYYFDLNNPINGDGDIYGYQKKSGTDIKTTQMPINTLSLVSYNIQAVKAGYKVAGFIRIKGTPDSAKLKARYLQNGITKSAGVPLAFSGNERYDFVWIIPQDTDQRSLVGFDVEIHKGSVTYGNEKWTDSWPAGNTTHAAFYIDGKAISDIEFNQSH